MESTLNILVVEDNREVAQAAKLALRQVGYKNIMIYHSAEEAIDFLQKTSNLPDIALLDIDLGKGKKNGFDIANVLNQRIKIPIIFWTSHSEKYLTHASMEHHLFLEKSISKRVLLHNIQMAATKFEVIQQYLKREAILISYRYGGKEITSKIKVEDIVYIEADSSRVDFYTTQRPYKGIGRTLSEFDNQLMYPTLFKIHHKYIVNKAHPYYKGHSGESVIVELMERSPIENGRFQQFFIERELPISKRNKKGFKEFMEKN